MLENKRIYQPAEVTLLAMDDARVRIKNRSALLNLNHYDAVLILQEDGRPVKEVQLPAISLNAGDSLELSLGAAVPIKRKAGKEYQLNLQFRLREATPWAPEGFVVSSSQVRWQEGSSWIAEAPSAGGKVALGRSEERRGGKEYEGRWEPRDEQEEVS